MARETAFDEVFDSQAVFRELLHCLSQPGKVGMVPPRAYDSRPSGFCAPALSILKTLCDHRVSFSIGAASARPDWAAYLEMNLSTAFGGVDTADFVLFDGASYDNDFSRLRRGTPEFPEDSATALLCVGELREANASATRELRLKGPGVKDVAQLFVSGLDGRYLDERRQANVIYPMGIDLFLVDADGRVAGIPRTSNVEA